MQVVKRNMIGMDMSHHNKHFHKKELGCWDFEIHKLTEGSTYTDPTVKEWWETGNEDTLKGVYHYLNITDTENQALHVAQQLKMQGMQGKVMFIIDYEDITLNPLQKDGVYLLIDFIKKFKGVYPAYQPVIYCNKTARNAIMRWCPNNTWRHWCLWLADYTCNSNSHNDAWAPIMRQWTSTPFDLNVFFGSPSSWKSFYKLW